MNYEELLNSKEESLVRVSNLPLGVLYKKLLDKKYVCVVDVHQKFLDNEDFYDSIRKECDENPSITDSHQLHFLRGTFDGNIEMLTLEQGNYITFEQLLKDTPSILGKDNFIDNVVVELLEFMSQLHSKGIYHVCFAPANVLVRKGDTKPLLLSHGSYYVNAVDGSEFYKFFKEYVAPEVLSGEPVDHRCDIYSLGKFIEYLFTLTGMPLEYKKVVKKATSENPDDRYQSAEQMLSALRNRQQTKQSVRTFLIALVVALIGVGAYFEFMPETEAVEFVNPVEEKAAIDELDKGFDENVELGLPDSMKQMTKEQEAEMKKYKAKCEQIFRKRYEKEADRILSKIYNSDYMGSNEKKFIAGSQSTIQELMDTQTKLATESNLDYTTSQRIASEIIDKITEQKKASLEQKGIQK